MASVEVTDIALVPTLPKDFTCQAVSLKEEWVTCLETKVNQKLTKMYSCYVGGGDLQCEIVKKGALPKPTSEEHAFYFFIGNIAKDIAHVPYGYASRKILFGK